MSRTWQSATSKDVVGNSARLIIFANEFCFETGCFVYHLSMMQTEYLKLQILFQL